MNHPIPINQQRGAATLFTALIILISITLVTFLTAKTVLVDTQISANQYRTAQATAAANAAMDYALAYLNDDGNTTFPCVAASYPRDADGNLLFTQEHTYQAGTGLPTTTASVCIDNTIINPLTTPWDVTVNTTCVTTADTTTAGMVIATGRSDDGLGIRTITQCVGSPPIGGNAGGADQTLVSGSSVNLTGSAKVINRYNDYNIWTANTVDMGSAAFETYIRPVDVEIHELDYTELIDVPSPHVQNAQKVSSQGLGTGTDVYANDGVLAAAMAATAASPTGDGPGTFFALFFGDDHSKMKIMRQAIDLDQYFPAGADSDDLNGLSRIVYVNGTAQIGGGDSRMGCQPLVMDCTQEEAVLLFVEGNLRITGATIYGMVYVTGNMEVGAGNAGIIGSAVVEGTVFSAGTLDLVYTPFGKGDGRSGPPLRGATGIIPGSWRDWQ